MPTEPRHAVIDIGSNTVRLAIFCGTPPNYRRLVDEKARCRLADGLDLTGRLSERGVTKAKDAIAGYVKMARKAGVETIRMVATAAVREAAGGARFAARLERRHGVPVHILSGEEEAQTCALGVMTGTQAADGIIADLGGGSLELVEALEGVARRCASTPLGHVRVGQRCEAAGPGALDRLIYAELGPIEWLSGTPGKTLYLSGGAWRKLARRHIALSGHDGPVHGYRPAFDPFHDNILDLLEDAAKDPHGLGAVGTAARLAACLISVVEPGAVEFSTRGLCDGCYVAAFRDIAA